jgi:hypothetical protein
MTHEAFRKLFIDSIIRSPTRTYAVQVPQGENN